LSKPGGPACAILHQNSGMILRPSTKRHLITAIAYLHALLFLYAATSKLLDFQHFTVELGQSPLLSAYAGWLAVAVPALEIAVAAALLVRPTGYLPLYGAFLLMALFTAYIFVMLHYSSYLPCSCGGILEKMDWNTHFWFNLAFVSLGAAAILMQAKGRATLRRSTWRLAASTLACIAAIVVLHGGSERIIQAHNPFSRLFPPKAANMSKTYDLGFNSYYFAGATADKIVLGNHTAPQHIVSLSSNGGPLKHDSIRVHSREKAAGLFRLWVSGPYFVLADGRAGTVYKGGTRNWTADEKISNLSYFMHAAPISADTLAFRSSAKGTGRNILGKMTLAEPAKTTLFPGLVKGSGDGIFDTDGMLLYAPALRRLVYVHHYSNAIIMAQTSGQAVRSLKTIDTVRRPQVKIVNLERDKTRTLAAPPVTVNKRAKIFGRLLFVQSALKGRHDDDTAFKRGATIDVYDMQNRLYLFSFYLFTDYDEPIRDFFVDRRGVFALAGQTLVCYETAGMLKEVLQAQPHTGQYQGNDRKPGKE
jgi:uncharacterized membrane protein YphA (DoxX/SURF4 family)